MKAEFEEAQKKNPVAGMATSLTQGGAGGGGGGMSNFDLAGWMAGAPSGGGTSGAEAKSSGRDAGGGSKRR